MYRIKRLALLIVSLTVFAAQASFAATAVPVYTLTVPESVSRGDIFNATVTIKSAAAPGVDYSADAGEYKLTGAMFKLTFPADDLEMVNAPQLASTISSSGLSITDYYVVGGEFHMTLDKASPDTQVTPVSIPIDSETQFVTLTFKAIRNSEGSDETGVDCEITIPADEDNTVIYQTGYDNPETDETETVHINSDSETSGGEGDQTKRDIKAKIELEYPKDGSHATTLSALYWQADDSNYVSYPGVTSTAEGEVQIRMERIAGKIYRVGFKRASSLISGVEGTDELTSDFTSTVFKLVEGDLNSDNLIDGTDFTLLSQLINWPPQYVEGVNKTGDINNDDAVDQLDVFAFNNVIQGTSTPRYLKEGFDMLNQGGVNPASAQSANVLMRTASLASVKSVASAASSANVINGRSYSAPKYSIINVTPSEEEGKYNISLTEDTKPITMLQLSVSCTANEDGLKVNTPAGWTEIGSKVGTDRATFAIGNTNADGEVITKDTVIATVESTTVPEVIYTGRPASTMELATENSVVTYDFEASSASDGVPTSPSGGNSGGSGGCNAGFAGLAIIAFAPFAVKRMRSR